MNKEDTKNIDFIDFSKTKFERDQILIKKTDPDTAYSMNL
jgi:hypothetical protein